MKKIGIEGVTDWGNFARVIHHEESWYLYG